MYKFIVFLSAMVLTLVIGLATAQAAHAWTWGDGPRITKIKGPFGPEKHQIDTDRKVWVVRYCRPYSDQLGFASYRVWRNPNGSIARVQSKVHINKCLLDRLGAGPKDRKKVLRHEKYHTKGWDHGQGNPRINAAYYPKQRITGR